MNEIQEHVILRIAAVHLKHFGEIDYSKVAILANASIGCSDITEEKVKNLCEDFEI